MRKWYAAHRERQNERAKAYRRSHKEQVRERDKRYYEAHKEQHKAYEAGRRDIQRGRHLALTHSLSRDNYDAMLLAQGGGCAICGKPFDSSWPAKSSRGKASTSPCVDHCHTTGEIRGLLCVHCNLMLGNARDDANILLGAVSYLDRHTRA